MPVWHCEATFEGVAGLLGDPLLNPFGSDYAYCGYAFKAQDRMTGVYEAAVQMMQVWSQDPLVGGTPSSPARWQSRAIFTARVAAGYLPFTMESLVPGDPWDDGVNLGGLGVTPAPLVTIDDGVGFDGGGTLFVDWDTDSDAFTFGSPLGNLTTTGTALGLSPVRSVGLRPISVGVLLHLQPNFDGSGTAPEQFLDFAYRNFFGSKNASHFTGAAVSQADPGYWADWLGVIHQGVGSSGMVLTTKQLTNDYSVALTWPGGAGVFAHDLDWYWRPWLGADRFGSTGIDSTPVPEWGIVLSVWNPLASVIMLRRSHDDGHSWIDRVVTDQGACIAGTATVQWLAGAVWVLYSNGIDFLLLSSRDLGLTWSAAMPLGISGLFPRLVIDRDTAVFFVFYCSGGNLVLQRSFDQGQTLADLSPITVAVGVSAQAFGATLAGDRTLVVSYADALTNYQAVASRDYGLTWSAA